MWYVGMDVHLKSSSVCVLNEQGCRVVQEMIRGPWPKLVEWLKGLEEPFAVCYESSFTWWLIGTLSMAACLRPCVEASRNKSGSTSR